MVCQQADLVKSSIQNRCQLAHVSAVEREIVRIESKLSAEEPAGGMTIDAGLGRTHGSGGDLRLGAIAALRSAGDVDSRGGLVGETIARFDRDRSPGAGALAVALRGDDRIGAQVDGIAGDQLDHTIDFAH